MDITLVESIRTYLNKVKIKCPTDSLCIIKIFYGYLQKKIYPVRRNIWCTKEFNDAYNKLSSSQKYCVNSIQNMIKNGEDLESYQSNNINYSQLDLLLTDWGIYHLHLMKKPNRTNLLIFCCFEYDNAYLIDIKAHQTGNQEPSFSDINLLEIIDNNWKGVLKFTTSDTTGYTLSNEQIKNLRDNGYNTMYQINGKTIFGNGRGQVGLASTTMAHQNMRYLKDICEHSSYIIHPKSIWHLQNTTDIEDVINSFSWHPSLQ